MKPVLFGDKTYRCANETFWPPVHSAIGSSEEVRFRFPDEVYERMKAWERACGLKEMQPSKCHTCAFLRNEMGIPLNQTATGLPAPPIYRRGGR